MVSGKCIIPPELSLVFYSYMRVMIYVTILSLTTGLVDRISLVVPTDYAVCGSTILGGSRT